MQCRDTKLLIDAHWDRHLPAEMDERLEAHLQSCPACRAEYGAVNEFLTLPEPVAVPDGLRGRILAALEAAEIAPDTRPSPASSYRWWMEVLQSPWLGAVAACMVFFFMGWFSHHFWTGPDGPAGGANTGPTPASPNPLMVASWTQHLALSGPVGPLPALAQAVALERVMQPELPVPSVRNRILDDADQPFEPDPAIRELLQHELFRYLSTSPGYRTLGV